MLSGLFCWWCFRHLPLIRASRSRVGEPLLRNSSICSLLLETVDPLSGLSSHLRMHRKESVWRMAAGHLRLSSRRFCWPLHLLIRFLPAWSCPQRTLTSRLPHSIGKWHYTVTLEYLSTAHLPELAPCYQWRYKIHLCWLGLISILHHPHDYQHDGQHDGHPHDGHPHDGHHEVVVLPGFPQDVYQKLLMQLDPKLKLLMVPAQLLQSFHQGVPLLSPMLLAIRHSPHFGVPLPQSNLISECAPSALH